MKILVDTNILFSAILFPRSKPALALLHAARYHDMVLCNRNILELRDILNRKAPKALPDAEVLLAELSYELISAVYQLSPYLVLCFNKKIHRHKACGLTPRVGLEPTTTRLTAECSTIELSRNIYYYTAKASKEFLFENFS